MSRAGEPRAGAIALQGSDPSVRATHDATRENYPPLSEVTRHDLSPRHKRLFLWLQKAWPWLAAVILVLIGIRVALPYALTWQMNRVLSAPGPYQGHVDGISLDLWRGAYQVHSMVVTVTRDDGKPKPLFSSLLSLFLSISPTSHFFFAVFPLSMYFCWVFLEKITLARENFVCKNHHFSRIFLSSVCVKRNAFTQL